MGQALRAECVCRQLAAETGLDPQDSVVQDLKAAWQTGGVIPQNQLHVISGVSTTVHCDHCKITVLWILLSVSSLQNEPHSGSARGGGGISLVMFRPGKQGFLRC